MDTRLKDLFEEIHLLTLPECKKCSVPFICCAKEYCQMAIDYCKSKYKIDLTDKIVNDKVPFLSKTGCVLESWQKPLCSMHVCRLNEKPIEFQNKYFSIRGQIVEELGIQLEEHLAWLKQIYEQRMINEKMYKNAKIVAELLSPVPVATIKPNEPLKYSWIKDNNFLEIEFIDGDIEILLKETGDAY